MDSAVLDPPRKRLLYRALHRGMKEADVIIGGFFQEILPGLPDHRLAEAEDFLELLDLDLMDWILGRRPVPEQLKGSFLTEVMAWEQARRERL
jgi:antitoxin CptB